MRLFVTFYVGMACVEFSIFTLCFIDIFPNYISGASEAHWQNVFGAQWDIVPMCPTIWWWYIDSIFGHFISRLRRITPKYWFDGIVFCLFYRLVDSFSLFVPYSQKYTYFPFCNCSPLHIVRGCCTPHPNVPRVCLGHIGPVEIHFLKVPHQTWMHNNILFDT